MANSSLASSAVNLSIASAHIVDAEGVEFVPNAGESFWVRVNFTYDNPLDTPYVIRRKNAQFVNDAPPVTLGAGGSGQTFWFHTWGNWVKYKAGHYTVEITLDADNNVHEANETDNSFTLGFSVGGTIAPQWDLVNAEEGRALLGEGTGVIVGSMDDALDFTHPWLTGDDSLGRPRLAASKQNTLGEGHAPLNAEHATAVMGIILARGDNDGAITGLAPDARYATAEFLNRKFLPGLKVLHAFDAAGFLVQSEVDVINMSWSLWDHFGEGLSGEGALTNLMSDYLTYAHNIVCVPALNQLDVSGPTAPASARNVLTVGGLKSNMTEAWELQNYGPTADGRSKPDLLGNDAATAVGLSSFWNIGYPSAAGYAGTSFTAPFVTGAVAQLLGYGKKNGESTDHLVMKSVIMSSAKRALDFDGSEWSTTPSQPLDDQQGTGVLDLVRAHGIYSAGEQTGPFVGARGYDLGEVLGTVVAGSNQGRVVYQLGWLDQPDGELSVTLAWDRHTFWNDVNKNGRIDRVDDFYVSSSDRQDNLDLVLLRNGIPLAESTSVVDTVEHLHLSDLQPGFYELQVERLDVPSSGDGERYGLAWYTEGSWTGQHKPILEIAGGQVSVFNGGIQNFTLSAGVENQNRAYFLLGSLSGTTPGVVIDGTGPGLVLPLNYPDDYLTLSFFNPNQPPLSKSFATLNASGQGSARFSIPGGILSPSDIGLVINHAFLVLDLTPGASAVIAVSNAAGFTLAP